MAGSGLPGFNAASSSMRRGYWEASNYILHLSSGASFLNGWKVLKDGGVSVRVLSSKFRVIIGASTLPADLGNVRRAYLTRIRGRIPL